MLPSPLPACTVFLGYSDEKETVFREFHFQGNREAVRSQALKEALKLVSEKA